MDLLSTSNEVSTKLSVSVLVTAIRSPRRLRMDDAQPSKYTMRLLI